MNTPNPKADISSLTAKRDKWVKASQENEGFEDGIKRLLTDLYPDNAHFIYELLQNAEDTGASRVRFVLTPEAIEFEHNGERLFDLKDVGSITSIGVSTKKDDATSIGKFGVGFKAVFAYTNTPEIHSGDFHFRIRDLVVPEKIEAQQTKEGTRFRFPFNNPKKPPHNAMEEISRGLRQLSDNTLLFLTHIRNIEYDLPYPAQSGGLFRTDKDGDAQRIEIQTISPDGTEITVSNWLRYHREVRVTDEDGKPKDCAVAVAFRLEHNDTSSQESEGGKSKKAPRKWRIAPCNPGQVSIFFPAEKETSKLHFHLHAPFASTVARDSVRDCTANNHLRDALAQLVADSLEDIRKRDFLDVASLQIMPNTDDNLSEFYEPIRKCIVTAFREKELVPTKSGSHRKAESLYRGLTAISDIIDDADLSLLIGGEPPLWAANAPQRNQREDRFLDNLGMNEWGWDHLMGFFYFLPFEECEDETNNKIVKWIRPKPDNWLMQFYALMWKCSEEVEHIKLRDTDLANLAIVRVLNAKQKEEHVVPSKAFFPQCDTNKEKKVKPSIGVWLVKPDVYEKGRLAERTKKAARCFLESIDVREYNEKVTIEHRLLRYKKEDDISVDDRYYRDIRAFILFWKRNPTCAELFTEVQFLIAVTYHDVEECKQNLLALEGELLMALCNILLGNNIPLDVLDANSGEIIIPANCTITKTLLARLVKAYDRIQIESSPVQQYIEALINRYRPRFAEINEEVNGNGMTEHLCAPEKICIDAPYEDTGFAELCDIHKKQILSDRFLNQLGDVSLKDFLDFLKAIGVTSGLQVNQTRTWGNSQMSRQKREKNMLVATQRSKYTIDEDWTIDNLDDYLKLQKVSASRLIWLALISGDPKIKTARWRCNSKYGEIETESYLVQALRTEKWIPDKQGEFHKPQDMSQEMLPQDFPYDDRNGLLTAIGFGENMKKASERYKARTAFAKEAGFESVEEAEEALALLKAKKEGRIREIPKDVPLPESNKKESIQPKAITGETKVPLASGTNTNAPSQASTPTTEKSGENKPNNTDEISKNHVLRNIGNRVNKLRDSSSQRSVVPSSPVEQDEDEDDYTPRPINYDRKIQRAEDRIAVEVNTLERAKELTEVADTAEKYSFAWFKALLELEGLQNEEGEAKKISIGFGKVEKEQGTEKTLCLKHPSRYISPHIEELTGFPLKLSMRDSERSVMVESVSIKGYTLRAKLKSADEIEGIKLADVVEARIDVKSPEFLMEELQKCFGALPFADTDNLQQMLPNNIEFVFGPPGTGKTTHLARNVLIPKMQGGALKVLVLTPTNKAADVLTARVISEMGADTSYKDWLVRFGTTNDETLEQQEIVRDRTFNLDTMQSVVAVTTIARFTYDGYATQYGQKKMYDAKWDYIVIDEASMISLANIVYPLYKQKPKRFVIAGDPFQIEPITTAEQWKDENIYTLVGLGSFAHPKTIPHQFNVTNLTTQYRSVPVIGDVFSRFAYDGILKHHRSADSQRPLSVSGMDINPLNIIKFPVSPYESIYRAKQLQKSSYQTYSALLTFEFIKFLAGHIQEHHTNEPLYKIGVISPYKVQAGLIDKLTASWRDCPSNVEIQVGTIHGFQGDECDIIITVFNPPPSISASPQMFLNKRNILNVAISRARDYLFILMPDNDTEKIQDLRRVKDIERLVSNSNAFSQIHSYEVERLMFGNERYLEDNAFSTSHQFVNVYEKPEKRYEVRSEDTAIDVQIHSDDGTEREDAETVEVRND